MKPYSFEIIRESAANIIYQAGFGQRTIPDTRVEEQLAIQTRYMDRHGELPELSDLAHDIAHAVLFGVAAHNRYQQKPHYRIADIHTREGYSAKKTFPAGLFPFQNRERTLRVKPGKGKLAYESLPGGRIEVYNLDSEGIPTSLFLEVRLDKNQPQKVTHHLWVERVKRHPLDGLRADYLNLPGRKSWRKFTPKTAAHGNWQGKMSSEGGLEYFSRWLLLAEQIDHREEEGIIPHLNLYFDLDLRPEVVVAEVLEEMKASQFMGWCD